MSFDTGGPRPHTRITNASAEPDWVERTDVSEEVEASGVVVRTHSVAAMDLTVFIAQQIHTMNPSLPHATAVVVANGMIIEVGTRESVQPWLDSHPHRIDETFADKVLLPGFIDPHLHPSMAALLMPMHFITALPWRLPDRTVAAVQGHQEYLDRLAEIEASISDPGEPLMTWGYHNLWHGELHRHMLNAISPTRPIVVWQRSFHEIFMNDAAIAYVGLDEARLEAHPQVDVAAGRFFESGQMMAAGQMTGYLTETARFAHGLEITKQAIHAGGHTTIGDLTGSYFDTDDEWDSLCAVLDTDDTPFRVQMIPMGTRKMGGPGHTAALAHVQQRAERSTEKLFYRKHVKLFADGGFFAQAMQVQPPGFIDGHHGEWMFAPEQVEELARIYWNDGYQIHVHCTGDMGVQLAIDVLEKLQWERPRFDHRFTIEHFGLSTPEQVQKLAALGAIVSANIYYVHELGEKYWAESVGHERASQMARLGTLARHGVITALHSDFTMAPAEPLVSAWVAVNRIGEQGAVLGPEERISVHQAMKAITIDAAFVLGMEHEIGSIRSGKKADFTVLKSDPYEVDPASLNNIAIWGTVFEGQLFPLDGQI